MSKNLISFMRFTYQKAYSEIYSKNARVDFLLRYDIMSQVFSHYFILFKRGNYGYKEICKKFCKI